MGNTTGTLTDAVMKMRRELPGWRLELTVTYEYYEAHLTPPPLSDEIGLVAIGNDNDWSRAAHLLVNNQIAAEKGFDGT